MSDTFRVSDQTIETAERAAFDSWAARKENGAMPPCGDTSWYHIHASGRTHTKDIADAVLAAVLPSLVAEIRESLAVQIEADALRQEGVVGADLGEYASGMRRAAHLARGGVL